MTDPANPSPTTPPQPPVPPSSPQQNSVPQPPPAPPQYAAPPQYGPQYGQPAPPQFGQPVYAPQKSRLAAGLFGIFLGSLGIHRFYLGYTGIGITMLLISVLSLGFLSFVSGIWGLIEGILILAKSGSYNTDARGIPLKD